MDKIDVVWGDTDLVPEGGGTMNDFTESLFDSTINWPAVMGALRERLGAHAHVGDIRGRGLFVGFRLRN